MNTFLRAIGFSKYKNRRDLRDLFSSAALYPETMDYINDDEIGKIYEFTHYYGEGFGIKFYGTESDDYDYDIESYLPFIVGKHYFNPSDLCVEKRYNGFSFIASCEDLRVGVSIIFQLNNPMYYIEKIWSDKNVTSCMMSLSALSNQGTVLLPITCNPGDIEKKNENIIRRASLIAAARKGDEQAIESLTFEDMDTYAKISKRIHSEDIFTIVDSSFIPYGLESDLYTIVADIADVSVMHNTLTGDHVYMLTLSYNGLLIDTVINMSDLIGEPKVGRRFKGTIWLQGNLKVE